MKTLTMTRLPFVLSLLVACCLNPVLAKQSDASKLGGTLTPMGAESGANADGSIPAWNGGLKPGAAPVSPTGNYVDPFAAEKPLYIVDKSNLTQYRAQLSQGQQAMFARYPEYRMRVFPTHRTARMPQKYQDQTRNNLTAVTLEEGGYGLKGYQFGVPFPEPTEGIEVLWNHLTRFRGGAVRREFASAVVQARGDSTVVTYDALSAFRENVKDVEPDANVLYFTRVLTLTPSRYSGEVTLIQEPLNQIAEPRAAWQYLPGQRRVRRAPTVAYDNSARYSFGQVVSDSVDGYNGAPDRYDWKLVGKQEMLVGYNAFQLANKDLKYADILKPGHLNPDVVRYEKHRVWVIEGALKPGARHVYAKRRFYIDEDTWQVMASDIYDSRGELWRNYESYLTQQHDLELPFTVMEATYDLISGGYATNYMTNEVPKKMDVGFIAQKDEFTPAQLKRLGK
jgi:hypothetical protein